MIFLLSGLNKNGSKEVTLTTSQMPSHDHGVTSDEAGAHSHNYTVKKFQKAGTSTKLVFGSDIEDPEPSFGTKQMSTTESGAHSHNFQVENTGGGQAHENRPPFYVLYYIIYLG